MRSKYGRLARVGLVGLAAAGLAATGAPASQAWAELQTEPPRLLITEVMYDPPGRDDEGEWIELANFGAVAIDLAGYGLGDESARGGGEGMARFPAGLMLEPGGPGRGPDGGRLPRALWHEPAGGASGDGPGRAGHGRRPRLGFGRRGLGQ